jgi:hypothetical protein
VDKLDSQSFIHRCSQAGRIKWSSHAVGELAPDALSVAQVELGLKDCVIIEEYQHTHRYLPDCLVLTFLSPQEPLHIVVAVNVAQEYILIVTVYRPTHEEWQDDWRTRR